MKGNGFLYEGNRSNTEHIWLHSQGNPIIAESIPQYYCKLYGHYCDYRGIPAVPLTMQLSVVVDGLAL